MDKTNLILAIAIPVFTTLVSVYLAFSRLSRELKNFKKQKLYELRLQHISAQISEFYGPIYMLTQSNKRIFEETFNKVIWGKTWKNIIVPAEKQVLEILKTKIHLLEQDYYKINDLPESFKSFIAHTSVTHSLLEDVKAEDVNFFELLKDYGDGYRHYPKDFIEDISKGYHRKLDEYENLLRQEGVKYD